MFCSYAMNEKQYQQHSIEKRNVTFICLELPYKLNMKRKRETILIVSEIFYLPIQRLVSYKQVTTP